MKNGSQTPPRGGLFGNSKPEIERLETVLCPLCGKAPTPFAVDYQGFHLCACDSCGTQFLSPRPVFGELLDRVYTDAYFDKEGDISQPDEHERRLFDRQLTNYERLLGRKGTLLDVGAGRGTFLSTARARGWEIFGVDVQLSANARKLECPMWEQPLLEIDFEGRTFDLIRFNHVLEHTQDPLAELRGSFELLNPGGILHVSVPNVAGIGTRLKNLQSRLHLKSHRWRHYAAVHHLFFFTPRTLRLFVEKAGFRLLDWETPVLSKGNQSPLLEMLYRNVLGRFKTSNILDVYCTKR